MMATAPAAHIWLHEREVNIPESVQACLSEAERERAMRFERDQDRSQRLATMAYKRVLLGSALDCDPAILRFGANFQGKPFLVGDGDAASPVTFNVSHTQGAIAVALGTTDVGVDIEYVGASEFEWDVVSLCFNEAEQSALTAAGRAWSDCAFALWTRKEALLKATGQGLAVCPLEVDTGVRAGMYPFGSVSINHDGQRWRVETRRIGSHWIASIATWDSAGRVNWHVGGPAMPAICSKGVIA